MYTYHLGKAEIDINEICAGTTGCWTISYEVGDYGFDDGGEILILRRDVDDSDIPQFDNPFAPGYVKVYTVHQDKSAKINATYLTRRHIRPWRSGISIRITDGSLQKGDQVFVQFGAAEGEGCGFRMKTFVDEAHIFRVLVDCAGCNQFYELEQQPTIRVTGGTMNKIEAVLPSVIDADEPFSITVRALDSWGNIAEKYNAKVSIFGLTMPHVAADALQRSAAKPIASTDVAQRSAAESIISGEKPIVVAMRTGIGIAAGMKLQKQGIYYITLEDAENGVAGKGNPIVCKDAACSAESTPLHLYWGDMHGQTKETIGTGTLERYFSFGRDCAKMDFCAWQGNDFQVTDETWADVQAHVKKFHEPGKFVTFLGYEWSGNTPVGGDYNIYFLHDDETIYRSSHWQIDLLANDGTDRSTLPDLWKQYQGRSDVMAIPHVGGRYGNLDLLDPSLVSVLEIHSHHGTFEWMLEDALKKGLQLGVIAASDDHTCRPGLSYPTRPTSNGAVGFDVMGGYTGIYAEELTREAIWDAYHKRHTYATSGERIFLQVKCGTHMMGDKFQCKGAPVIDVQVVGTDEIMDVEIKRGADTIYSYEANQPIMDGKVKVQWSGVRVRSRNKKTVWDGNLAVKNGSIKSVAKYAFDQPDEDVSQISNQLVTWKSATSGDIDGFVMDLIYEEDTELLFSSPAGCFHATMKDVKKRSLTKEVGGVNQKITFGLARECNEKAVNVQFTDKEYQKGVNAYWVKVTQKDGHMAWSSPMYIMGDNHE